MSASECHCNAKDVPHTHDWLVWFAQKVASEDERRARLPGSSWCLMLREDEAHGVVTQANELVQREAEGQHVLGMSDRVDHLVEGREGMLTVYDHRGRYRGCIGAASWDVLLAEGDAKDAA